MRQIPQSLMCLHSMVIERFSASFFVARPSRLIHGACVLKLPSLIAAALALLASFCSQAFIDRHSSPGASTESSSAAGCPARLDGLLQHIWLAEQIQAERMQLARLRAEREALEMRLQTQKTVRRSAQGHQSARSACEQGADIVRCLSLRLRRTSLMGPHRPFVGAYCRAWLNGRPLNC
ncbi:hypothetical protein SME36J_12380 [Serratia marcescens]|nr:hypothetical protein SME06J_13010 [Serratia marcescens]BEM71815.1 hypothetical protein SME36J_12380 [Serratia marcescens]